jgi:hypothetical protein
MWLISEVSLAAFREKFWELFENMDSISDKLILLFKKFNRFLRRHHNHHIVAVRRRPALGRLMQAVPGACLNAHPAANADMGSKGPPGAMAVHREASGGTFDGTGAAEVALGDIVHQAAAGGRVGRADLAGIIAGGRT